MNFHKKCSHLLEEIERQLQNAIGSFEYIYNADTTLTKNPTTNGAISLIEKSKNLVIRATKFCNVDFPKICFDFNN